MKGKKGYFPLAEIAYKLRGKNIEIHQDNISVRYALQCLIDLVNEGCLTANIQSHVTLKNSDKVIVSLKEVTRVIQNGEKKDQRFKFLKYLYNTYSFGMGRRGQ